MLEPEGTDWPAVIGRALAFIALSQADVRDKGLVPQAELLEKFGLSRKDTAALLGTTTETIRVMLRQQRGRKKKGGKRGSKSSK